MIQRIQTVYLLLSTFLCLGLIFWVKLWTVDGGLNFYVMDAFNSKNFGLIILALLFLLSGFMSFINIFLFKRRQVQFVLGRVIILINFILLSVLVYYSQNLSGEIKISEKGIGLVIPILSIVLVSLANKAIKKDDKLVKSVNRIR
ncbi:MAG: DUF4293 domain-containing protein [Lutibacter sp.]